MPKLEVAPSEALYPVPVVLVSSFDRDANRTNIVTLAWCGVVASNPPQVSISIRPSRHSHKLITKESQFAINIPTAAIVNETDFCGVASGRDTDKFKNCKFTPTPASKITAAIIKECPVNIECKVNNILKLGSHDIFVAEVVSVHLDVSIMKPDGTIDFAKADPIVFNRGEYWNLGKKIGFYGCSSK